jgi:hypothetical protein
MHHVAMNDAARNSSVAILSFVFVLVVIVCWQGFRRSNRPWLFPVIGGYNIVLLALFTLGLVRDDGYGWAFLPFMIAAAPWSFLAPALIQGPVGNWFVSGLVGNFVLFVVLCGGINNVLLYTLGRRIFYPSADPARPSLL